MNSVQRKEEAVVRFLLVYLVLTVHALIVGDPPVQIRPAATRVK